MTHPIVANPSVVTFILSLSLHTLPESIGLSGELQKMCFVREPVQQSSGQAFITEDLRPVSEAQVSGYDQGLHGQSLAMVSYDVQSWFTAAIGDSPLALQPGLWSSMVLMFHII